MIPQILSTDHDKSITVIHNYVMQNSYNNYSMYLLRLIRSPKRSFLCLLTIILAASSVTDPPTENEQSLTAQAVNFRAPISRFTSPAIVEPFAGEIQISQVITG